MALGLLAFCQAQRALGTRKDADWDKEAEVTCSE